MEKTPIPIHQVFIEYGVDLMEDVLRELIKYNKDISQSKKDEKSTTVANTLEKTPTYTHSIEYGDDLMEDLLRKLIKNKKDEESTTHIQTIVKQPVTEVSNSINPKEITKTTTQQQVEDSNEMYAYSELFSY